jgi:hypothetical protein
MTAVEYLTKKLKDLFSSGIGDGLTSTLKQYGEAFRLLFIGVANSFAGAALKALIAGLRDMRVLGVEIFNQGDMNAANMTGNRMEDEGAAGIAASNKAFSGIAAGGGGFFSGLMKGLTTETSVAKVELAAAIASAEKTGKALVESGVGKAGKKFEVNQAAIGTQEPYKVIADSLAKVGGGGGFISSSMSIEAREAVKANQARALQLQVLNNINAGVQRFAQPVMLN